MPALAKPAPILLPRTPFAKSGAAAGAGPFLHPSKTSAQRPQHSDTLDGLAHDARNVISGLMLYCELLSMPGVLNQSHGHYAQDLESIVARANRMLERIAETATASQPLPASSPANYNASLPAVPVTDAAEELRHAQPLLTAITGPAIKLSIATMPCAGQTALAVEDLTRILVNLVRNAADAMPSGGRIRITAQYGDGASFRSAPPSHILLTVTDSGPGIPEPLRAQIFDLGFTTRRNTDWPSPRRRGLGLSIIRNLVQAAGGSVQVHSAPGAGARFEVRLPLVEVTSGTCVTQSQSGFSAGARGKGCIECQ